MQSAGHDPNDNDYFILIIFLVLKYSNKYIFTVLIRLYTKSLTVKG